MSNYIEDNYIEDLITKSMSHFGIHMQEDGTHSFIPHTDAKLASDLICCIEDLLLLLSETHEALVFRHGCYCSRDSEFPSDCEVSHILNRGQE